MHHDTELRLGYLLVYCSPRAHIGNRKPPLDRRTFAALLGVDLSTLRHWRNGTREPSASVVRLLEVLDVLHDTAPALLDALVCEARNIRDGH